MSDFQKLRKIERIIKAYEAAKQVAKELGSKTDFTETDKSLDEVYLEFKKRVSGGIVSPNIKNAGA